MASPDNPISLNQLSERSSHAGLELSNQREWLPTKSCVAHLVMQAAQVNPGAVALSAGMQAMSYAELSQRMSKLASYLVSLGVGPDMPVALCFERSFDFITSALAVFGGRWRVFAARSQVAGISPKK